MNRGKSVDKETKIIIVIVAIGLLLMLISLGHDLFSNKNISSEQSHSAVVYLTSAQVQIRK